MKIKSILFAGIIAATSTLLSIAPTYAAEANSGEIKIGYVNIARLFREAPIAVKAADRLEKEFSKRDQELQNISKKLRDLRNDLEKNALTMAEDSVRAKEKELADLGRDFQRKQREFNEDLNTRQNEENSKIIEKANIAIKQISESEKYDLILQDVVWVNPRLDITDKIIKNLGDDKK